MPLFEVHGLVQQEVPGRKNDGPAWGFVDDSLHGAATMLVLPSEGSSLVESRTTAGTEGMPFRTPGFQLSRRSEGGQLDGPTLCRVAGSLPRSGTGAVGRGGRKGTETQGYGEQGAEIAHEGFSGGMRKGGLHLLPISCTFQEPVVCL